MKVHLFSSFTSHTWRCSMIFTFPCCQGTWSAKVLKARCTSGMERKMRASSMLPSGADSFSGIISLRDTNWTHHVAWYFIVFHHVWIILYQQKEEPNHLEIIPGQAAWWRQDEARAARAWKLMERVLPKEWAAWNDFGMTDPMQSWPKTLWSAQSAPLSLAFPWTCRCLHTSQPGIAVWSAQPLRRARQIRNHPATHKVPKMPAPKILDCGHVRNQKQIQVWGY